MKLDRILSDAGRGKTRRRRGRGKGSGAGKTCGRGHKGAGQRAGRKARYGYEGGQNPALFRVPKRGFNNANFRVAYQVVNVVDLGLFDAGQRVDREVMAKAGMVRRDGGPVKILGDGRLGKELTVVAEAFSAAAEKKILAAGGSVERPQGPAR